VNHDSCSILVRSLVKFWIFIASVIFLLEFFIAPDFPLARHAWSPGLVLAIAPSSLCFLRLVPVPCSLRAALPARVHPRQIIFSLGISDPRAGLAFCPVSSRSRDFFVRLLSGSCSTVTVHPFSSFFLLISSGGCFPAGLEYGSVLFPCAYVRHCRRSAFPVSGFTARREISVARFLRSGFRSDPAALSSIHIRTQVSTCAACLAQSPVARSEILIFARGVYELL
jgi:hypothetical protein